MTEFQDNFHMRWMIRRDIPEVLQIEAEAYSFMDPDFEVLQTTKLAWSEEDFLKNLRQRNVIGMVVEQGEAVVGYVVYELHKQKIEILKMEADKKCDVDAIYKDIFYKMMTKLSEGRRERLQFCVPEKDLNRQIFLKNCGFRAKKVIQQYFQEDNQDGYLLEKALKEKVF